MASPIDQLSDAQRKCLRLVGRGHQTKEIAKQLGLTPNTIDTYLRQAIRTLGVSTRFEAARVLERQELSTSQDLRYQPHTVAMQPEPVIPTPPRDDATPPPNMVQERHPPFDSRVGFYSDDRTRLYFGGWGGPNTLTTGQRLLWMAIGTVLILLAAFLGLAVTESVERTLLLFSGDH